VEVAVPNLLRKSILAAASAVAFASITYAGPAQADKAENPADVGSVGTEISDVHVDISKKKAIITFRVDTVNVQNTEILLHGKVRFAVFKGTDPDPSGKPVYTHAVSPRPICQLSANNDGCYFDASTVLKKSKFKKGVPYVVFGYFDAKDGHLEADSNTNGALFERF